MYYNYSVDLPYTKTKIKFRELNTEEQLALAKANMSFAPDKDSLYDYNEFALNVILNCVENEDTFKKINIIEYVLFLTKLRTVSVGVNIDFILKTETESKVKTKIQIDLKKYMLNLYKNSNFFENDDNSILSEQNIEIKLNWPVLTSIATFNKTIKSTKNQYHFFNDSLCEFIEYIKIDNNKILYNVLNEQQKIKLFDKIPLKIKDKLQDKIVNSCKILFESNLFEISFFNDYKFNFYNLNFIEHIKMLFSYDIRSIFQDVYFLASYNISPQYIMGLSHMERKIYMTIIEESNKKKDKSEPNMPEQDLEDNGGYSDAVKKLALEFNQQ
jgi:hypothetical protein